MEKKLAKVTNQLWENTDEYVGKWPDGLHKESGGRGHRPTFVAPFFDQLEYVHCRAGTSRRKNCVLKTLSVRMFFSFLAKKSDSRVSFKEKMGPSNHVALCKNGDSYRLVTHIFNMTPQDNLLAQKHRFVESALALVNVRIA